VHQLRISSRRYNGRGFRQGILRVKGRQQMIHKGSHYLAVGALVAALLGAGPSCAAGSGALAAGDYNPVINPQDFVSEINNKYFTLKPGTKFTYKNKADTERIEATVTNETMNLMGVATTGVRVTEWRNGRLKEDTTDWYAQDKEGNVWYFGESVNNFADGKLVHHAGSWQAGVDGAKPGIIMRANPQVGDSYRQEFYPGQAEDMGTVVAIGQTVTVPHGTLENCVQIRDTSPLDPIAEFKYFCPDVGFLALEEVVGRGAEAELVSVTRP
jgi:hypothetical protein